MKKRFPGTVAIVALIVAACAFAPLARAQVDPEIDRRINEYNAHFDAPNQLSGVLLIARGDEVVFRKAYGMAHHGLAVPNTVETRFPIASINKVMTTVVLTKVLQQGATTRDATLAAFAPDFPRADEITIEMLARHRAGIPHRVTTFEEESLPLDAADILEFAKRHELIAEPGATSIYSSAGYTILARCLEIATGKSFPTLLEEFIFEPAGMAGATDAIPGRETPGLAQCYVPGRGDFWPAPLKGLSYLHGAGSVIATADDLWRFLQSLRDGTLRFPFSALAPDGKIAWTGASNGAFAFLDTYPDDNLTCIWLGNSWGGCAGQLRGALPQLIRGETVTPPVRPELAPNPSAQELAAYAGEYSSRPGATYKVRVLGDELWFADSVVLSLGEDRFWHQPWWCEIGFIRDDAGRIIASYQRTGPDQTQRFERIDAAE